MRTFLTSVAVANLLLSPLSSAFSIRDVTKTPPKEVTSVLENLGKLALSATLTTSLAFCQLVAQAADQIAPNLGSFKLNTGGASTSQSGQTIAITRGVNLDNSSFEGQDLKAVAFQQSIVRDSNFKGCNLVGASFFDATLDGSDFENADMSLVNLEMAQMNRANMKNTVAKEMYVSGATLFTGIKSIENSDWSDTYLRADQQKYP